MFKAIFKAKKKPEYAGLQFEKTDTGLKLYVYHSPDLDETSEIVRLVRSLVKHVNDRATSAGIEWYEGT